MSHDSDRPGFWVRVIADERFRDAVIDDPLRALAETPDVDVSAEQVRQLEAMTREEREVAMGEVFRQAHFRGGVARFGAIGLDGRLGGAVPPE